MNILESVTYSRSEWENIIDEWIIGTNSERNRKLIKRRLLDGIKYEPLAEEFELSVQHTKEIVYACTKTLSQHI